MNKQIVTTFIIIAITILSACQTQNKTKKKESWVLNSENSSIAITTIKNNQISEVSYFKSFSGNINQAGYLNISIDLNSLETNIPIRNERMAKHLFETDLYPTADIHTQLKPGDLDTGVHNITFDADLHGVSSILTAEFMVTEQLGNKVITLHKPLIINASSFALEQGITTLRKLAKLNAIANTVPLHLILTFQKQ